MNICPVCLNKHSNAANVASADGGYRVDCPVCGRFALPDEAWEDVLDPDSSVGHGLSDLFRAMLSHRLRTEGDCKTATRPMIDSEFLNQLIANGAKGPTPLEQATNIIKFVGEEVSRSGKSLSSLPTEFYAVIGAPNPRFAAQLASDLVNQGFLNAVSSSTLGGTDLLNISLTLDGWDKYEAEKRGKIAGNYGFIAMQFNDSMLDPFVNDTVKPAVNDGIGFSLVDMRDVARAGVIDNIMRAQIRDAAFVIVDLTHDNSGAYWEAGYAEGLGKPVIYICEKSKFDDAKTHFDTNHCTTVPWSVGQEDEFKKELIATLRRSLNLFPREA